MTTSAEKRTGATLDLSSGYVRTLAMGIAGALFVLAIALGAWLTGDLGLRTDLSARSAPPSLAHPFGTDQLGRDMLARTTKGLAQSLQIGIIAATISGLIAMILALAATMLGRLADAVVSLLVDMAIGLPHLITMVLIAFAMGGGRTAVITAVALTHWPRLARVLRAEIMQVQSTDYVKASRAFGKSQFFIARHHLLPHLVPQFLVGTLLMLPHAILHEAGLTFIGFGLEPGSPAIGVMLSEAMRFLTAGDWWLGVFPGLGLLLLVLAFDGAGNGARALVSPREAQD